MQNHAKTMQNHAKTYQGIIKAFKKLSDLEINIVKILYLIGDFTFLDFLALLSSGIFVIRRFIFLALLSYGV